MLDSLIFSIALSTHIGLHDDFNNVHPHVQYQHTGDYIAGMYYNSDSRIGVYVGKKYQLKELVVEAGIAHGYKRINIAPMIKVNYNGWYVAPGATTDDVGLVTGYEVKF